MKAVYLVIALIGLSPCIVASLNAISIIWGNWWLIPAGMIVGAGLVITGNVLTRSGKNGP